MVFQAIENPFAFTETATIKFKIDSYSSTRTVGFFFLDVSFDIDSGNRCDFIPNKIRLLNDEIFETLKKNPGILQEISPRKFEEIIAGMLHDMGCDVELTPKSKDGGRDILAAFRTPFGKFLTIVECKRYKSVRKIGIDIVERFLHVIDHKDKASCGLIATTSYFTRDARAAEKEYKYKLKLHDFNVLKSWIKKYGHWSKGDNGLWFPA